MVTGFAREKNSADGEVVAGQTTVDESMLTGEPVPVLENNRAIAGTLNQSGAIASLPQLVKIQPSSNCAGEAAQTRKASQQRLADTAAGYFYLYVLVALPR